MDIYEQLRADAAKKRQAAVQRARHEYQETLKQIDSLRSRIGYEAPPGRPKRQRSVRELVLDAMPKDRAFTFADISNRLKELEPNREFNQVSLRTLLRHMAAEGILDRISKNQAGRVLWAVKGAQIEADPYGSTPLTDVAESFLRDRGPMTPTELVVAIQESGYRPDANPRRLIAALRTTAQRYPERFLRGDDGRWSAG